MIDVLEFWIRLHSHPKIEISFKFIPNILMNKECIHFLGPLCINALVQKVHMPLFHPAESHHISMLDDISEQLVISQNFRFILSPTLVEDFIFPSDVCNGE